MGFGKGFRVAITDVIHGVNPWEIGIEGGTVLGGSSRWGGLACGLRGGGDRGQECLGALKGGCAYPM